jgi:uncharacterized protein (UPF0333 family)
MLKKINRNKSGVSLMLSYVILISIVLFLSIGVYFWLKVISNAAPATDCKEGTSIFVIDYQCLGDIRLSFKNNGYFNIDGVILAVGNDTKKAPTTYLLSGVFADIVAGHYNFDPPLKPGEIKEAKFIAQTDTGSIPFPNITVIQVQPYIIDKNQEVICNKAVIQQNIESCNMRL